MRSIYKNKVFIIGVVFGAILEGLFSFMLLKEPNTAHEMNPYMMREVNSEKQFLEDMTLHHQAAITMSEQLLKHNPSLRVKKFAEEIIETQSGEIEIMQSWLNEAK